MSVNSNMFAEQSFKPEEHGHCIVCFAFEIRYLSEIQHRDSEHLLRMLDEVLLGPMGKQLKGSSKLKPEADVLSRDCSEAKSSLLTQLKQHRSEDHLQYPEIHYVHVITKGHGEVEAKDQCERWKHVEII